MSGSLGKFQGVLMNLFQWAAAAGLLTLIGGVAVVNIASAPRAGEIGTIMAGCGVGILALLAFIKLIA
jgi:hypothetical protein